MSNQNGEGITSTAFKTIANLYRKGKKGSRPLTDGEYHFYLGNWIGPGTQVKKYWNTKPINIVDAQAEIHDKEFYKIGEMDISDSEKKDLIRKADKKFIQALKDMGQQEGDVELYRKAGLKGIQTKKNFENFSPILASFLLPSDIIGQKKILNKDIQMKGDGIVSDALSKILKFDSLSDVESNLAKIIALGIAGTTVIIAGVKYSGDKLKKLITKLKKQKGKGGAVSKSAKVEPVKKAPVNKGLVKLVRKRRQEKKDYEIMNGDEEEFKQSIKEPKKPKEELKIKRRRKPRITPTHNDNEPKYEKGNLKGNGIRKPLSFNESMLLMRKYQ